MKFGTGAYWCGIANGKKLTHAGRKALRAYFKFPESKRVMVSALIDRELVDKLNKMGDRSQNIRVAIDQYLAVTRKNERTDAADPNLRSKP